MKHDNQRGKTAERGYDGAWQRLRAWHLARHPLCVYCEQMGRVTAAEVVDHITPFNGRGDPLRLDPANLQSLCAPCHDGAKQALDKTGVLRGCSVDGTPIDAGHHWRRG